MVGEDAVGARGAVERTVVTILSLLLETAKAAAAAVVVVVVVVAMLLRLLGLVLLPTAVVDASMASSEPPPCSSRMMRRGRLDCDCRERTDRVLLSPLPPLGQYKNTHDLRSTVEVTVFGLKLRKS